MVDGPNFEEYRAAIERRNDPTRVPIGELFVEAIVIGAIADDPVAMDERGYTDHWMRVNLDTHARLGYDAITVGIGTGFALPEHSIATDTASELSRGLRSFVKGGDSLIWDRESFERYPWPTPEQVSYYALEQAARLMPEGMEALASIGGPCEWLMWICGYEPLSYMIAEDPELVHEVMGRIREQMLAMFRVMVTMDRVGAAWISDDMGYKTGTFLSPAHMREFVFPTQKALAEVVHAAGLPVLLHSCGDLHLVMDDLIDYVGIDAKHSYEDVITPVAEAKRRWGNRIGIIGGVDVDMLTRGTAEEVRRYTLRVLEECAPNGGYLLGSGNSVANYIPVGNYLAMLDAWREWSVGA
jgi:uroporphyrinogen decarboxylase